MYLSKPVSIDIFINLKSKNIIMTATILVVDDLNANVKLLEAKLLNEYYTVVTATNGIKALQALVENKIDIVLLDVMMPEMNGFETCARIKSNPETAHIGFVA